MTDVANQRRALRKGWRRRAQPRCRRAPQAQGKLPRATRATPTASAALISRSRRTLPSACTKGCSGASELVVFGVNLWPWIARVSGTQAQAGLRAVPGYPGCTGKRLGTHTTLRFVRIGNASLLEAPSLFSGPLVHRETGLKGTRWRSKARGPAPKTSRNPDGFRSTWMELSTACAAPSTGFAHTLERFAKSIDRLTSAFTSEHVALGLAQPRTQRARNAGKLSQGQSRPDATTPINAIFDMPRSI